MYNESIETITGRMERMCDRLLNAGIAVGDGAHLFFERINHCATVAEALAVEQDFTAFCDATYEVDWPRLLEEVKLCDIVREHADYRKHLDDKEIA